VIKLLHIPWGANRQIANSGTGLLVQGSGCITYNEAYETSGTESIFISYYDGSSSNGRQIMDYQLLASQSTSESWGLHWMPFIEGVYVVTNAVTVSGSITIWGDHDCAQWLWMEHLGKRAQDLVAMAELAELG
jgi:hypothetical protein